MPHQCTSCGRRLRDGSQQLLNGCPECDGATFQFVPSREDTDGAGDDPTDSDDENPVAANAPDDIGFLTTDDPENVHSGDEKSDADVIESETTKHPAPMSDAEDDSQQSARTEMVSLEELTSHQSDAADGQEERHSSDGSDSDLDALREELNSQFDGIRVVSSGQYEINLTQLYERDSAIISLREDGRYVVNTPHEN